ncbi:MAG: hypothetical protein MUP82_05780 [Candidatus Marinimicrobia bacterium]|nr:hypothetical protein [Candidatus Neomarinimicrobiota bacterium]
MVNNGVMSSTPEAILGGAKRRNGHKQTCSCHICDNIKKKAKRGGYADDAEKELIKSQGGSKKKNGHSPSCGCPICKNMKNAKKGKKGKRGGSQQEDEDNDVDEKEEEEEKEEKEEEEEKEDEEEKEEEEEEGVSVGGKRIKRSAKTLKGGKRKGNGHKPGCMCPICKNMRKKSRKGGNPDEMLLSSSAALSKTDNSNMTQASDTEYDDLDNIPSKEGGGTRRRRAKRTRRHKKRTHKRR